MGDDDVDVAALGIFAFVLLRAGGHVADDVFAVLIIEGGPVVVFAQKLRRAGVGGSRAEQENGAQNKQFFHCNTHIRGLISDIIVFENYLKTVNNTSIKFFMKRDRP